MYLDYSKLKMNADGTPVRPNLRLQTLDERRLGYLNGVHGLNFKLGFAELSEISFEIPYMVDGLINPLYEQVVGYKVVWTADYGVYLLASPEIQGSGLEEVKSVRGYSIEKHFERKRLFLEEGRYKLYDELNPNESIFGRILELDNTWKIVGDETGILDRQQWMDEYNDDALSFMYGKVMEAYHCMIVFDPYPDENGKKAIYVYDAGMDVNTIPVYLSYQNLMEEASVKELTDELVTKISVYGADNLSIRDVSPIGNDYLINLDYFIENGDIPSDLANKYDEWEALVSSKREYYAGLTALRASATARKIALESDLVDLKADRSVLVEEQNGIIQKIALESDKDAKAKLEKDLADKTKEILDFDSSTLQNAQDEIDAVDDEVAAYTAELESILHGIKGENNEVIEPGTAFESFFSSDEQKVLNHYLIEDTVTEESFVASELANEAGTSSGVFTGDVLVTEAKVSEIAIENYNKTMYTVTGGTATIKKMTIAGETQDLSADIIRGTVELNKETKEFLCSLYLGSYKIQDLAADSLMVTLTGTYTALVDDIIDIIENEEIAAKEGTQLSFSVSDAKYYLTADVGDYQKYSEAKELYDFGVKLLEEKAHPTYEFSIDTANFLFQREFEPFKNRLKFGEGVYLMLGSMGRVVAPLIGMDIDFDDIATVELTFSNRFQRIDGKKKIKEMINKTYSSSRSFDTSKFVYEQAAKSTTLMSSLLKDSIDAANRTILAASDQSVVIDGGGIHVGANGGEYSNHQLRIINRMIAMTDDSWESSKLAIGLLKFGNTEQMGINAEVLMGNLIVGESMHIINEAGSFSITENGVLISDMDLKIKHGDSDPVDYATDKADTIQQAAAYTDKAITDGVVTTYFDSVYPTPVGTSFNEGDLWFVQQAEDGDGTPYEYDVDGDGTNEEFIRDRVYRYSGTTWEIITDAQATQAIADAAAAHAAADGSINMFYEDEIPVAVFDDDGNQIREVADGDLWYTLSPENGASAIETYKTSVDTPFSDMPSPYKITWDGNIDGLISIADQNGNNYYKVSDLNITADDCPKGGSCTITDDGTETTATFTDYNNSLVGIFVLLISEAGQYKGEIGPFPEPGIYFAYNDEDSYVCSLCVNRDKTTNAWLDNEIQEPYILMTSSFSMTRDTGKLYVSSEPLVITDGVIAYSESATVEYYTCTRNALHPTQNTDWTLQETVNTSIDVSSIAWTNYTVYASDGSVSYKRPVDTSYAVGKLYCYDNGVWELIEDSAIDVLETEVETVKTDVESVKSDVLDIQKIANDNDALLKAVTDGEFLKADTIRGYMEVKSETLAEASGVMSYLSDGLWLADASEKEDMTEAVWITGGGIMLGELPDKITERTGDPVQDFEWKTAITSGGVMASGIIAGSTVSGINIVGGTLGIGDTIKGKVSDTATTYGYPFSVSSNGSLNVGYFEDEEQEGYVQLIDGTTIKRPFSVSADGKVTARGITFLDEDGNAMMNDNYQFGGGYLDLKGLKITKENSNGTKTTTFEIDTDGNVILNGSIKWDDSDFNPTDVNVDLPDYIESTYIDSAKIIGPTIIGGTFAATGQGRKSEAAYYIYNGTSGSGDTTKGINLKGFISFDDSGSGTEDEAADRVLFSTETGVALKIEAGGNISIEAAEYIYIPSTAYLAGGFRVGGSWYGTSNPNDLGLSANAGQIYFQYS